LASQTLNVSSSHIPLLIEHKKAQSGTNQGNQDDQPGGYVIQFNFFAHRLAQSSNTDEPERKLFPIF
jgi:hypothetical protein